MEALLAANGARSRAERASVRQIARQDMLESESHVSEHVDRPMEATTLPRARARLPVVAGIGFGRRRSRKIRERRRAQ